MSEPFGDQLKFPNSSTLSMEAVNTVLPRSTSTTNNLLRPSLKTLKANRFESGDQAPADSIKLNSSICEFFDLLVSFRRIFPVWASARKRSILNKSFSDKKAIYFPFGEMEGARL